MASVLCGTLRAKWPQSRRPLRRQRRSRRKLAAAYSCGGPRCTARTRCESIAGLTHQRPSLSPCGAISERRSVLPAGMRVAHRNNGKERYGRRHSQDNHICHPTPHARQLTIHAGEPVLRLHNFRGTQNLTLTVCDLPVASSLAPIPSRCDRTVGTRTFACCTLDILPRPARAALAAHTLGTQDAQPIHTNTKPADLVSCRRLFEMVRVADITLKPDRLMTVQGASQRHRLIVTSAPPHIQCHGKGETEIPRFFSARKAHARGICIAEGSRYATVAANHSGCTIKRGKRSWHKRQQKTKSDTENTRLSVLKNSLETSESSDRDSSITGSGGETELLSISRGGEHCDQPSSPSSPDAS